ncbi:MAG TPA: hypothetical protein PLK12_14245 [Prolixibacteraceae bacterium]|nr:hypothetical protein [Prolixibacteraceae bacterium]
MNKVILFVFFFIATSVKAQPGECKLRIGTNLSGLCDWMTEMPFVDMMRHARTWGTRNVHWIEGGANTWNT